MKGIVLSFLCSIIVFNSHAQQLNTLIDKTNQFFTKYVKAGSVNYKGINKNFEEIKSLYTLICDMDLSKATPSEKKAFYINAYNLIVIYQITKHYDFHIKSPMDQSGFFDKNKHKVAGEFMTLNFLEIKKLLYTFKDPRIHFVLACGAKSCPPLSNLAYKPDGLDEQIEKRTRLAINDNNWIRVNKTEKKVLLSKIFSWYQKDFTTNGKTVLQFVNSYRTITIPENYETGFYEYDWSLNGLD